MKPETILYDNAFEYDDGTTGKKFLIVLNDGKWGFYIVVKTSSKRKDRNTQFGCQLEDRYPNFFLPENSCWFDKNTWVELERYYEFQANELLSKRFSERLKQCGVLDKSITCLLLECAIESEDISIQNANILKSVFNSICS